MGIFGIKRKKDNNRKKQIENLILELNKIALLRSENEIGKVYKIGGEPEKFEGTVELYFEGECFEIYTNRFHSIALSIKIKKRNYSRAIAQYDSDANDDIIWSDNGTLNQLAKRLLTQYKTLTEDEIIKNA